MRIAPISNNLNYRKTNKPTEKQESAGKTGMSLPSFRDAKSLVNVSFKGERELFQAVYFKDFEKLNQELSKGTDINCHKAYNIGETPLICAVVSNFPDVAEVLLEHPNIDVNATENNGYTALAVAAIWNYPDMAKKILEHPDVDVNIKGEDGRTAYDRAQPEIKRMIETYQPGVDRRKSARRRNSSSQVSSTASAVNKKDENGRTALHLATKAGDSNLVRTLLDTYSDIDINAKDNWNNTPLMLTTFIMDDGKTAEQLLKRSDIDVNAKNNLGNTALIMAVKAGNIPMVKKLLERPDVDLKIEDSHGSTALYYSVTNGEIHNLLNEYQRNTQSRQTNSRTNRQNSLNISLLHAAREGLVDELENILKNPNVDVNAKDEDGNTALIWASYLGYPETLKKILEHPDVDINIKDSINCTALDWAKKRGHQDIEQMIQNYQRGVDRRKNVNNSNSAQETDINAQDSKGRTALHRAIENMNMESIDELLQNPDVDINLQDNNGNTALIWAASRGRKITVEKLLQRPDIDVNLQDQEGNSALLFASQEGYHSIVKELLKHPDVDINLKNNYGNTALKYARARGYATIAELIETYERGVDKRKNVSNLNSAQRININAQDSEGRTALHRAVEAQDIDEVEKLLQNPDVNVNLKDKEGCTALIRASYKRDASIVEKLLQRSDIDVNAQGNGENTALIWASYSNISEVVDKLLEHPDIDIRKEDFTGRTAFEWARKNGRFDMAAKILNYERGVDKRKNVIFVGPDINAKDKRGFTPLLNAVDKSDIKEVEKLLQNPNVDVNAQTPNGNTALMIAANRGEVEIVKKILEHPDVDIYIKNKMMTDALSCASITTVDLIKRYQRGVDNRKNALSTKKGLADKIQVDINKLSPEENIWSEEEISKKFVSLLSVQRFDDAIKMLNSTPLINLEADNRNVISRVCMTGNPEFVEKVFEYRGKQDEMREAYQAKRNEFFENKINTLSYEELKENPIALHTEDGFKILMSKPEFNPNDTVDKKSLFDFACDLDSKGTFAKQILSKYDDVDINDAKKNGSTEIKALAYFYENVGKYQVKFDKIKRNIANPETRSLGAEQLKEFINSSDFKPDMTDSLGNSALHIAATMPDDSARGIIQKLIDKGIDINAQNITNQNALISAIKTFRITQNDEDKTKLLSNIKFLIDKGIDVNEPDNNGQTAFHHACSTTSVALLSMILSK
ncbi:ankyrin repeat domain-containing protein, partial [bacterium]|nr:ankyrin repeat domain-containing protein [bacterium]